MLTSIRHRTTISRGTGAAILALIVLCLAVIVAFAPGLMSPDTLDMCNQAVTGVFGTWHAPIVTHAWSALHLSPLMFLVLQVAGFVGAVFVILQRWLRLPVAVVGTAIVTLSPLSLIWIVVIGKDAWALVALLWIVALLGRFPARTVRGSWLILAAVGFVAWWAIAARSNMPPIVLATLWGASIPAWWRSDATSIMRRYRPRVAWCAGTTLFVGAVLISQSLWNSTVVKPVQQFPIQATQEFDLAAISLRTGTDLIPPAWYTEGSSIDDVAEKFQVEGRAAGHLIYPPDAPLRTLVSDHAMLSDLGDAWRNAIISHPFDYLSHRLAFGAAMLGLRGPHPVGSFSYEGARPDDWNLSCALGEPHFPRLLDAAASLPRAVDRAPAFRMWWISLAFVAGALAAGLRSCREARLLVIAGATTLAVFFALSPVPNVRYLLPVAVGAALCWLLALRRSTRLARQVHGPRMAADDPNGNHRHRATEGGGPTT